MSLIILAVGALVFFAHFLVLQFRKTNIPDVLILMAAGLVMGPVTGLVSPDDFGKAGSVLATIALVVILFESGTSLNLKTMTASLSLTGWLAVTTFILTSFTVSLFGFFFLGLTLLPSVMLGLVLGGTSSAVVIPVVDLLKIKEKPATALVLESALTDVLCIIGVFTALQIYTLGEVNPGKIAGNVLAAMVFAAGIGVAGGAGWLFVLGKVRDFPNTISSTLAYAFIIYGITELLGFSGAISALTLGITMSNFQSMGLARLPAIRQKPIESLTSFDLAFYKEAVFLLKTFFFVYLGISIRFSDTKLALLALMMMAIVFTLRIGVTRLIMSSREFELRETAVVSMMVPKGLAAAVLASLPVNAGVPGGEIIRDTTYMVVLISISLTAILVILFNFRPVRTLYSALLNKPAEPSDGVSAHPE